MKYDFDQVIDRHGTDSSKWDCGAKLLKRGYTTRYDKETIPLFNADMDFKCAPEIIKAMERVVARGIYGYTTLERKGGIENMAIEVKNISYTYPGSTVTAVENVSMKIEKGERVAIIGQNGAGKSTTVKLMNNIYKPTSGEIIIDGINTKNQTTAQTAPHVGYVFQNPNDQIFNDDVIKEIEYVLRYWKLSEEEIKRRREEAIDVTGIRPYLEMHPFDIPLPIRKFLTIAVVVAVSPDYVILDEPTAGQDLWGCAQLRKVMDYLQSKGKAVITISHDMEYVAENFERIIVMAHKNVIADGKKEDIFYQKDKLQEAYVKPPLSTQIAQEVGIKKNILNMQELINCYK